MKRISDENGINAGARNAGRLFLFSIPLTLGLTATVWLGLWVSGWEFQQKKAAVAHEFTQQERAAAYVGAQVKPTGKIAVQLSANGCFKIIRADLDIKPMLYPLEDHRQFSLVLYAQDACRFGPYEVTNYRAWHWQSISPNGTVIGQDYKNSPLDDRIDHFRVWGSTAP